MIAPVGEKLLFERNKISATRGGGGDLPCHPPPLDPPLDNDTEGERMNSRDDGP